jgi:hypothetical protein
MKFKVQLVMCAEDGREETVQDLTVLDKDWQCLEHLGLTLAERSSSSRRCSNGLWPSRSPPSWRPVSSVTTAGPP